MTHPGARIGRLLLGVNVFVLIVPILAILLLRIYENMLVEQTERRLIAESVIIGEAWRTEYLRARGLNPANSPPIQSPGTPPGEQFFPIDPVIDLRDGFNPSMRIQPETPGRQATERTGPSWQAGQAIKPLLDRAKLVNLSGARVLNASGCAVASTGSTVGECLDHLPEVQSALNGIYQGLTRERFSDEPPPSLTSMSRRGRVRVFTATPIFSNGLVIGVVRMSRTSVSPVRSLWQYREPLIWAFFGCLGLTLLVSLFFAQRITRPVREITLAAQAIARGEARRPLPAGRVPLEVFQLSGALDTMTQQLQERAAWIADFAANVSHELKTPLTGIRGAAELLRDAWTSMDDTQRQRFLNNIDADATRMQTLVTGLLHLARIEHSSEEENIPVADFATAIAQRYPDIDVQIKQPPTAIQIDPSHLTSAIGNLIDNAVEHGQPPIHVTFDGQGDQLQIIVRDHGSGISSGNRDRVFDRFFTTDRDGGGTGLGLAVVKAVARARGGSVTFESDETGTLFTLVL